MDKYDIIIIGGGVVGTAIARELSRYKLKIALLEKEEELAFGVSKSNSGIIHAGTQNVPGSLKGRLCVEGNRLVRILSAELGFEIQEAGQLIVAFTGEEVKTLEDLIEEGKELGVSGLRIVDREWLKRNEPNLSEQVVSALYVPSTCIVSPYRMVYGLAENSARNGVDIFTGYRVLGINPIPEKAARFEVLTSQRRFCAEYVINAAGLFSDKICGMVGINDFKISPRKGEEFLLDKKRKHLTNHLIFPLPSEKSKGIIVIKTADGNPMIGPTAVEVDDREDLSTSDEGLHEIMKAVRKMVPSVDERDIIAYFAGLRPVSGNDFIIRHEDNVPGFITVAGIQSPGLTSAPAIAVMVKEILQNKGLKLRKKTIFYKHRKRAPHLFETSFPRVSKIIKKHPEYGDMVCRCEMVSAKEVNEAIDRGAATLDGIKFRTRAQAGRCHGGFCTARLIRMLSERTGKPVSAVTKKGKGSEMVSKDRRDDN